MSKFLLVLGVSGAGKSVIIRELLKLDSRFRYISPFVTRPLRAGEIDKVHMDEAEMLERYKRGEFVVVPTQVYSRCLCRNKKTGHGYPRIYRPLMSSV